MRNNHVFLVGMLLLPVLFGLACNNRKTIEEVGNARYQELVEGDAAIRRMMTSLKVLIERHEQAFIKDELRTLAPFEDLEKGLDEIERSDFFPGLGHFPEDFIEAWATVNFSGSKYIMTGIGFVQACDQFQADEISEAELRAAKNVFQSASEKFDNALKRLEEIYDKHCGSSGGGDGNSRFKPFAK